MCACADNVEFTILRLTKSYFMLSTLPIDINIDCVDIYVSEVAMAVATGLACMVSAVAP